MAANRLLEYSWLLFEATKFATQSQLYTYSKKYSIYRTWIKSYILCNKLMYLKILKYSVKLLLPFARKFQHFKRGEGKEKKLKIIENFGVEMFVCRLVFFPSYLVLNSVIILNEILF